MPNGDLNDYQVFGPRDHGALVDGITFDSHGNLWGTHVFADQIFIITPEGELRILLDDAPRDPSKKLMDSFYEGKVTRELMMACRGAISPWTTSITFGGPDLKTVYVGSIFGTSIATFQSPVSGLPLPHWKQA
jgi:sugar lactone lactonase YvrE